MMKNAFCNGYVTYSEHIYDPRGLSLLPQTEPNESYLRTKVDDKSF